MIHSSVRSNGAVSVAGRGTMAAAQDTLSGPTFFTNCLQRCRESRKLVLFIVAIALLLDNMLLTTVGKIVLNILSERLLILVFEFSLATNDENQFISPVESATS